MLLDYQFGVQQKNIDVTIFFKKETSEVKFNFSKAPFDKLNSLSIETCLITQY